MSQILVVDDEINIRKVLSLFLTERGHSVATASSGEEALVSLDAAECDLLLLDVSLPGLSGLDLLARLRDQGSQPTCIVMTAFGSIRSAVDAMRAGAFDYITKPFDNDQLLLAVERALDHRRLRSEVESLRSVIAARHDFPEIVAVSAPMRDVFRMMSKVALSEATVLILGESGTGKELVARGIHRKSRRNGGPFVAVNCSAIPGTLIEAEFFGFERGAFTDARETRPGKFEQAHGGTLFLDEVGDLALDAQAKLLRVLQDKQVTRIGGRKAFPADVRVLAATNKNLDSCVADGRFREDLFFRLNVLSVSIPPLRDRGEDIGILVDEFVRRFGAEGAEPLTVAPEARRLLLAHSWPGNVRELENTIQRAVVIADRPVLRSLDLPRRLLGDSTAEGEPPQVTLAQAVARTVERLERNLIQAALGESRGSRTQAAQRLGINRKTLFNKMKEYKLISDTDDDGCP